jgi:hypothetical protein
MFDLIIEFAVIILMLGAIVAIAYREWSNKPNK